MKSALYATAAIIVLAAPLHAADMASAPTAFDWTGFYVGVDGGYDWAKSEWHNTAINGDYFVYDPKGWTLGGHVGVNKQMNSFVLGIEGDLNYGNVENNNGNFYDSAGVFQGGYIGKSNVNWQGSGRVRVGLAADRVMPYITGGIAIADYDYGWANGGATYSANKMMTGWTAGAGIEFAVNDRLSVRAQYLYADYGAFNHGAYSDDQGVPGYAPYKVDLTTSTATIGMSLHF